MLVPVVGAIHGEVYPADGCVNVRARLQTRLLFITIACACPSSNHAVVLKSNLPRAGLNLQDNEHMLDYMLPLIRTTQA